jgi:hypothetical protein
MPPPSFPFTLPTKLEPALARVFAYWDGLKRADNNMPFWDDVRLSAAPDQGGNAMLIDVFAFWRSAMAKRSTAGFSMNWI